MVRLSFPFTPKSRCSQSQPLRFFSFSLTTRDFQSPFFLRVTLFLFPTTIMRSSAAFCVLLTLAASYALAAPISPCDYNFPTNGDNTPSSQPLPLPYRIGITLPNKVQPCPSGTSSHYTVPDDATTLPGPGYTVPYDTTTLPGPDYTVHNDVTTPQRVHPVDSIDPQFENFPTDDGIGPAKTSYPQRRDKHLRLWKKYVEKFMTGGGDSQPKAFGRAKEDQVPHARNFRLNSEANLVFRSNSNVENDLF